MKKIAILLTGAVIFFTACDDNSDVQGGKGGKTEGDEQIQGPVPNSGPEAEAARATDAVRDSATRNSQDKSTGNSGTDVQPH